MLYLFSLSVIIFMVAIWLLIDTLKTKKDEKINGISVADGFLPFK